MFRDRKEGKERWNKGLRKLRLTEREKADLHKGKKWELLKHCSACTLEEVVWNMRVGKKKKK